MLSCYRYFLFRTHLILRIALCGLILQAAGLVGTNLLGQEDLRVVGDWMKYTDAPNALYHHLTGQAYELLDRRAERIATLRSREDWERRQQEARSVLLETLGPFPERTPLNARVVGRIEKERYSVENVIFESMPSFHVTASLFIPKGLKGRAPAILFCSGHSEIAYRRPYYQLPLLNLVQKGFVVLAIDPLGQGERLQYFDGKTGKSKIGSSTKEHSYPSAQTFLTGKSVARYFTWDGIRAIDYLSTREEVDSSRIGCHGLSGGGTQTAYISALDDRVLASAPAGYITSYRRLMESDGVQDGEQNFYHGIVRGIDHADFLEVRAPKPTLIVATTADFFSIQGARETFREAQSAFQAFGKPSNVAIVEDDHGHGYTRKNREAVYAFFQEHLSRPGPSSEEEVEFLTPEELQKTETGQLETSLKGETVFSVNLREAKPMLEDLGRSRRRLREHSERVVAEARRLSGFLDPGKRAEAVFTGRYQRDGYVVEKYFLPGEGRYVIPFLLLKNSGTIPARALLYLNPAGKRSAAAPGGELEWFVRQGYAVLAPDLLGVGEMGPGSFQGDAYIEGFSYNQWFNSILIGRSIVGVQSGDLVRLVRHLQSLGFAEGSVSAIARGAMCPVLLHAAAFEKSIAKISLINPLVSYESVVTNRFYAPSVVHSLVAGALTRYDLPDLAAAVAPRPLLVVDVADQNGKPVSPEVLDRNYGIVRKAYADKGVLDRFRAERWPDFKTLADIFEAWVK